MEDHIKNLAKSLLAYGVQRDLPLEKMMQLSNIRQQDLDGKNAAQLTSKQVNDLWLNASLLSGDKLFGLHFGESLQLAALGVVGQIIKNSNTVGEALTIAAALTPLIAPQFHITVNRKQAVFTVEFSVEGTSFETDAAAAQMLDFLMVFVIHEMDGLVLKKIQPLKVVYGGRATDMEELQRVFRCAPIVERGINAITFDATAWDNQIIAANYELLQFLLEKNGLLKQQMGNRHSLKERISGYLMTNSYLGIASIEELALNFNVSTRTLQRKLKDEGANFQQIADDVKKLLAIEYLNSGSYQLKEISYMLGYNETSAFTRTFKRWTGLAPSSFKKNIVD